MICLYVVPSGPFPEHLICLSPRCQRRHSNPEEAKQGNQGRESLAVMRQQLDFAILLLNLDKNGSG